MKTIGNNQIQETGKMRRYEWFDGMGRICLTMNQEQVDSVSHQGECYEDAEYIARVELANQLSQYSNNIKIETLKEYGAWSYDELLCEESNNYRLVWIAGCDIKDDPDMYELPE